MFGGINLNIISRNLNECLLGFRIVNSINYIDLDCCKMFINEQQEKE